VRTPDDRKNRTTRRPRTSDPGGGCGTAPASLRAKTVSRATSLRRPEALPMVMGRPQHIYNAFGGTRKHCSWAGRCQRYRTPSRLTTAAAATWRPKIDSARGLGGVLQAVRGVHHRWTSTSRCLIGNRPRRLPNSARRPKLIRTTHRRHSKRRKSLNTWPRVRRGDAFGTTPAKD